PAALDAAGAAKLKDAVIESPYASRTLKAALGGTASPGGKPAAPIGRTELFRAAAPTERRLRVFAFDPAASISAASAGIATTTISIPWEKLEPGPSGEYIEVI